VDLDVGIDPTSAVPPYEQLRSAVAARVADGRLPAGTKLPTVRALASDLGLAVNTVAKTYRALESDGVVETRGRAGTFVASDALAAPPEALAAHAADYARHARRAGLTLPEAEALLQRSWEA
jgi:DNA-binding transcriptional regulator YhcF (GntR family)